MDREIMLCCLLATSLFTKAMIFTTSLKAKGNALLPFSNIAFYESDDFYNFVESKRQRSAAF
ncbi:hypothetical protein [Leptospira noguchii]|uniref:hypothetical protein n=1 Tax=Leptospira noguchii TaxID=28182 RepID=UPI001FB7E017|nr:hypothetical protein [Leptospira noguchii]UOG59497.1 hypothetical protein MAL07_11880 [Leptospira noguchii]